MLGIGLRFSNLVPSVAVVLLLATVAAAQPPSPFGGLDGFRRPQAAKERVQVKSDFVVSADGSARIYVTAKMLPEHNIYSLTQKPGGPIKSRITLEPGNQYQLTGEFQPDKPPKVSIKQDAWPDLPVEEHFGTVTWSAPIRLAQGADPNSVSIQGKLSYQVCFPGQCIPGSAQFTARRGERIMIQPEKPAPLAGPTSVGTYRAENSSVEIQGKIEPQTVQPGDKVFLKLTAIPDAKFHVYAFAQNDPNIIGNGKPTLVALDNLASLRLIGLQASEQPSAHVSATASGETDYWYDDEVTWTVALGVPPDAQTGEHTLSGIIGYHVCFEGGCERPEAARFQATITVGEASAGASEVVFAPARYREASQLAESHPMAEIQLELVAGGSQYSLAEIVFFGLLGGLILNLMPCVLPVIGLKVMSFVEQSGHSRGRALWLNIWYSLGIVSVFAVLALLAVSLGFKWGEQFGDDRFNIILAVIVFAMGLSLLGVWEIPIPGFLGSGATGELAAKEGPVGAFLKGVITTILATPCTGPFMGTALAFAVKQPPATTFTVFLSVGIGMASPYLLIGAFPNLIRFLPKPGAWMETFKQIMGFILLATVIFLLSFIHPSAIVPTVALLIAVGVGCWWISRTPAYDPLPKRLQAWAEALVVVGLGALVSFGWLQGVMQSRLDRMILQAGGTVETEQGENELPWQYFTPEKFASVRQLQKPILIDFTADWCLTCKTLEKTVLNTAKVKAAVESLGFETIYADYTRQPPEISKMIDQLGGNGVPLLAIFPPGADQPSAVFKGGYTQSTLIAALEKAAGGKRAATAREGVGSNGNPAVEVYPPVSTARSGAVGETIAFPPGVR